MSGPRQRFPPSPESRSTTSGSAPGPSGCSFRSPMLPARWASAKRRCSGRSRRLPRRWPNSRRRCSAGPPTRMRWQTFRSAPSRVPSAPRSRRWIMHCGTCPDSGPVNPLPGCWRRRPGRRSNSTPTSTAASPRAHRPRLPTAPGRRYGPGSMRSRSPPSTKSTRMAIGAPSSPRPRRASTSACSASPPRAPRSAPRST